jgi:hypothetical protein
MNNNFNLYQSIFINTGELMDNKYQIIEKNDKLITSIIVLLATILTVVSLSMIAVSSLERTANSVESIIMTFLAGSIALSAHLLPALTKRRVGHIGGMVVTVLWIFSVLVTLYSHTVFFVSAGVHAGEVRSQQSTRVEDLKENMELAQKEINDPNIRSVVAISRDISTVEGRIALLRPRDCSNCKTTKSKISELESTLKSLNIEMKESQRVAALRDKTLNMNDHILSVKDNARLDPVTEKLSVIFKGMNVDAITLFLAVLSSALLETLAALFWWLVWPNQKMRITDQNFFSVKNNNDSNNKKIKEVKKKKSDGEPLFSGEATVSTFKAEPDDKSIDNDIKNKEIENNINLLSNELKKDKDVDIIKNFKLKKKNKTINGYKVFNKKVAKDLINRTRETFINEKLLHNQNEDLMIKKVDLQKVVMKKAMSELEVKQELHTGNTIEKNDIINKVEHKSHVVEENIPNDIMAIAIPEQKNKEEIKNTPISEPVESIDFEKDIADVFNNLKTEENINKTDNVEVKEEKEQNYEEEDLIDIKIPKSFLEEKLDVDIKNAQEKFENTVDSNNSEQEDEVKIISENLLDIQNKIPDLVSESINKMTVDNNQKEFLDFNIFRKMVD